jgi:hypothetical protein
VRFEQQVRRDRGFNPLRLPLSETWLRVLPNVGIGPAVERTFLDVSKEIGHQTVAKAITFLHHGIKLARRWVERKGCRITQAGRKCGLVRPVGAEALDRGLYLRFNADVARRANSDEKRAVFRVNREMPVYVTLDDAEHPLLGDHSLANQGGRDWAALSGNTACTLGIVGVPSNCHAKVDALVTFAGRLGFALDRVLLYGKGGTAFAAPPPLGDMAHQPVDHNLTPVDVYFGREDRPFSRSRKVQSEKPNGKTLPNFVASRDRATDRG